MSLTKISSAQILPTKTQDDPAVVAPEACVSMDQVRAGIDALDIELVGLIARRTLYIEAAARIKPGLDEVRVPWRIEDVVTKVLAEACKMGLSTRLAEPVWRELIEQSIRHEGEVMQKSRKDVL